MPKMKTKSSAKKRFRLTGSGQRFELIIRQTALSTSSFSENERNSRGTMIL